MEKLTKVSLSGFKSIRRLNQLEFGDLNVLVGANGAGKSNFISFFRMLGWIVASLGNLQAFVGKSGSASSFLFEGSEITQHLEAELTFQTNTGENQYMFKLSYAAGDSFVFVDEQYRYSDTQKFTTTREWMPLGVGHKEAKLVQRDDKTARFICGMLRRCVVYQFHNTAETSRIRQKWDLEDARYLKEDAANLAPFLYRLRESHFAYYQRVVETLRLVAPFFNDFFLEPDNGTLMLKWTEKNSDLVFGAHQASDGTLRVMALLALLMQPEDDLPSVLILDEPELGLHPYAITIVAGLLKSISRRSQIVLATQSPALVDQFEPKDVIVVDRPDRESIFRRLDEGDLRGWLEEYSLAELWEKNVIGGRP